MTKFIFQRGILLYVFIFLVLCFLLLSSTSFSSADYGEIRVVAALYEPFVFYENGRLTGLDIDLLDLICRLNKLNYTISIVSFQEVLNMLKDGRADVGIGAIYITEERKKFINFTKAYLNTGLVYVTKTESRWDGDLSNKKVGVKRLATGETLAKELSKRFNNLQVIPFSSTEESIDALIDERVDVVINDYLNTESLMHERFRGKIKIKKGLAGLPEFLTHDYIAIAINKQRPDLLKLFNDSIKEMKRSGMFESLLEHWPSIHTLPDFKRYLGYGFSGLAGILFLFILIFRFYRKRQVYRLLQESEERYRAITEYSPDAVITANSKGNIILANSSAFRLFGYSKEDLVGKPVTVLMPESCKQEHLTGFERILKTGRPRLIGRTYETMGRRKDRTEFPLELSLSTWETGGEMFFTAVIRDITERKRAEESLMESESRFRSVIENAPNPVVIHCYDGSVVFVNKKFTEITGYRLDDINTFERFISLAFPNLEYRDRMQKRYDEILKADSPYIHGEDINITCSDGSVRIWNMQSAPIGLWFDKKALMCVARDVTEHRRLEEQLRQAQKMEVIGRFTGGIAHDFNNYLTAITGFSQLAFLQLGDHPARESLENVLRAAEKACSLTTQLLAFSRRQVLRPEVLNLNDLIADMMKMIKRIIGEDIEVRHVFDPMLWNVKIDAGQMEQVILNLVSNARDAMPEGGVLTIQTTNVLLDDEYAARHATVMPGEYVMMAFEDTGIGMTEEVKNRIFEPFFTTKEVGKGTGLGLATVYGIIKQSGGYIWVYSEPNEGTTFKIYLPRTHQERSKPVSKERIEGVPGGKEGILVVEDSKEVREFIVRVLKELGYNIYDASDGVEALEVLRSVGKVINLVLTDVMMPNMRGDRLAERIKESYPEIKVLFMSGYADNIITKGGILKNGINYLQKPLTAMILAQTVRRVLDS